MEHDLISHLLGAVSALLVGLAKTGVPGAAIPAVALMAEAFPDDVELSVGAMLPILLVGDLFAVGWYRRHAQWKRLWSLFPYVLLGMVPGVLVLWWLEGNQLRPVLGCLVLGLFVLEVLRQRLGWNRGPERWWFQAGLGVLAGFGTMVGNAAGPVMTIYLLSRGLDKRQFVGTAAWFFLLVNLCKIVPFWTQGMITRQTLAFDLVAAWGVAAGAALGIWLLPKIPQQGFNRLVLALAGLAGLWMLLV